MEKTRVPYGESYWWINSVYAVCEDKDWNTSTVKASYKAGNYYKTKEEAEAMARKLRAVLKGAEVIEMPSEEELKEIPIKKVEGDAYIDAYFTGVMDILDWIKHRKQMKEDISRPRIENEVSIVDWIKSKSKYVK